MSVKAEVFAAMESLNEGIARHVEAHRSLLESTMKNVSGQHEGGLAKPEPCDHSGAIKCVIIGSADIVCGCGMWLPTDQVWTDYMKNSAVDQAYAAEMAKRASATEKVSCRHDNGITPDPPAPPPPREPTYSRNFGNHIYEFVEPEPRRAEPPTVSEHQRIAASDHDSLAPTFQGERLDPSLDQRISLAAGLDLPTVKLYPKPDAKVRYRPFQNAKK